MGAMRRMPCAAMAIAAFNAGPGRVRRAIGAAGSSRWPAVREHLPASTRRHISHIFDEYLPRYQELEDPTGRPAIGGWRARPRWQ